jgi:hypothetical protein
MHGQAATSRPYKRPDRLNRNKSNRLKEKSIFD